MSVSSSTRRIVSSGGFRSDRASATSRSLARKTQFNVGHACLFPNSLTGTGFLKSAVGPRRPALVPTRPNDQGSNGRAPQIAFIGFLDLLGQPRPKERQIEKNDASLLAAHAKRRLDARACALSIFAGRFQRRVEVHRTASRTRKL